MERIKKALERARQERQEMMAQNQAKPRPVRSKAEPEPHANIEYTHTHVIETPRQRLKEQRVAISNDPDPITDAYKMLRTRILSRMRSNKWKSLAITSPGIGEGKSLTAVNLAISISMEVNYTVLLVDFDLRRPCIHTIFGYTPKKGISDYLLLDEPLEEILFNPGIERLVVLPGHVPFQNSSEMLSSPKMVQLVEEVKTRYPERIVIFDLPPLLAVDDALAFSPYVDTVLMVVEEGKTKAEELARATEMLQEETEIIGTVLNKASETNQFYY